MSLEASIWAWRQDVTPSQKLVLLRLADQANDSGECWPSHGSIGLNTGLSRTAIKDALRSMRAAGLIAWHVRSSDDGQTSNMYTLNITVNGVGRRPGGSRQTTRGGSPDDQGGVARRPGGGRQTTRGGSPDDHESLNESLKESTNEPINEPPQEKQASERFGDQLGGGCGCDAMDNAMDGVTANDARPVIYSQPPPGRTVADFFVMHPMCYRRDCRDEWQALLSRAGWDIMCQAYDEAARRKPDGKLLFVSDLTDVIVWDEED